MVYLLDRNSGTGMSQDHIFLAQAINERYPEYSLAQVPLSERSAREEFPFAILVSETKEVVKPLRESEMNINVIFRWLYENDHTIHGVQNLFEKYKAQQAKEQADKKAADRELLHENLDFVHTIANSALHTFRHGQRKFG